MSQEAENKIVVKNLSKTFDMYNSPMDKLKEALSPRGKIRHTEFHALTDLSFNVKKGEILGIMGRNGAGKSTLLKIITGILEPTSGSVEGVAGYLRCWNWGQVSIWNIQVLKISTSMAP